MLFAPFLSHKYLLFQLTQREIKARYKQSIVGYAWVILNPLAQLLVYTFVFSVVLRFPQQNIPYSLFVFAGLLPWNLFQGSIIAATQSLVENSALLRKVVFPREIIPYSIITAKTIDFFVASVIFVVMMMLYRVPITLAVIAVIPLFLTQIILIAGISLFLATCNLFYRDIQYLASLVLMLWMYMSPVVYPLSLVPQKYAVIYQLNPMVGIIEGYRSALFATEFNIPLISWSIVSSILIFITSYLFFKSSEKVFADIV